MIFKLRSICRVIHRHMWILPKVEPIYWLLWCLEGIYQGRGIIVNNSSLFISMHPQYKWNILYVIESFMPWLMGWNPSWMFQICQNLPPTRPTNHWIICGLKGIESAVPFTCHVPESYPEHLQGNQCMPRTNWKTTVSVIFASDLLSCLCLSNKLAFQGITAPKCYIIHGPLEKHYLWA